MSVKTPEKVISGVCHQKTTRDKYLDEGSPLPDSDLKVKSAIVRPVSYQFAKRIILKYEWLGTMSVNSAYHYGIFFKNHCAGVCCFCVAGFAIPGIVKMLKADPNDLTYLSRGACVHWAPPQTNSKLIARSLKFEKERGKKVAVAFSDQEAGEIGTVYQASNWLYLGTGKTNFEFVSPHGKKFTNPAFTQLCSRNRISHSAMKQRFINEGWTLSKSSPKHRYLYILNDSDKRLSSLIRAMSKPYPKRPNGSEGSVLADTSGVHPEKSGSIPTPSLQSSPSLRQPS